MLNIFDLAKSASENAKINQKLKAQESGLDVGFLDDALEEKNILICGSTSSGKSSFISRFLSSRNFLNGNGGISSSAVDLTKRSKTIALDFSYLSKNTESNRKELGYIWELGGGGSLASLLEIILTPKNFRGFSVLVFLDLTRPEDYQSIVEPLSASIRKKIKQILDVKMHESSSDVEKLIRVLKNRFAEHKDSKIIKSFEIPLTIIAAKYDLFQNFETDKKRNIARILRYLAHINGANLLTLSNNMENLVAKSHALLTHLAFNTGFNYKMFSTGIHEPVFVGAGADSIESIDLPVRSIVSSHHEAMSEWSRTLADSFSSSNNAKLKEKEDVDVLLDNQQFAEPLIDQLVEAKTRDLELFIKRKRDRHLTKENAKQRNAYLLFTEETF